MLFYVKTELVFINKYLTLLTKQSYMSDEKKPIPQVVIKQSQLDPIAFHLADPSRPAFYANGFSIGATGTECVFIFTQNNISKVAITLPFEAVLSLKNACNEVINTHESNFSVKVRTVEEIGEIIAHLNQKK